VKENRSRVERDAQTQSYQETSPMNHLIKEPPPQEKWFCTLYLVWLQLPLAREHWVELTSMPLQILKKWVSSESTILDNTKWNK